MGITTNQITDTLTPSTGTLNVGGAILPTTALAATAGGTAQSTYTTGDTLYASATNTLAKLPIGTNGQVLTVAGGIPSWATPSGGGGGPSGSARTSEVSIDFTEVYVTAQYALPVASSRGGTAYRIWAFIEVIAPNDPSAMKVYIRVGTNGTTADTIIWTWPATVLAESDGVGYYVDATITFRSSTSTITYVQAQHATGGSTPVWCNSITFDKGQVTSSLTSSDTAYLGMSVSGASDGQFKVPFAVVTRVA